MNQPRASEAEAPKPSPQRGGWSTTFAALSYPNFRLLWFTTILTSGGNWIQQVTIGWLAFEVTGSPIKVAFVMGARALPLLAAPLSGVIADRFDRRRILMLDHVGLMVTAAGFAAIVMTESLAEWHLYAFSFLTGIAWSINNPIRQALIANSVPRESLMNAVALNSMAFNSMRMIGPAIGGSLIALVGPGPNFLIQAIMYVGVLFALIPYRAVYAVARPGAPKQTAFQDLREGISYVVHTPLTLTTIVLTMIPTFTMMAFISTQLPVYTAVVLGDDGGGSLGLLFSAMGLGGFIGTLVIARFSRFERKGMLSLLSVVAAGIMLIALTQAHTLWTAALILAIQQLFFNTVMITNNTILQTTTPDHMRGRVMGVLMIDIGLQPLGGVIAGVIVSATSVAVAWGIGGAAGLVAVAIVALTARSFRRLKL